MTIEKLEKALLGKYIHFPANYKSEKYVWGGVIKKVEEDRLKLIPYFDDKLIYEKDGFMPIPREELETLVSEGRLIDSDFRGKKVICTQLLNAIPKNGEKRLITIVTMPPFFTVTNYRRAFQNMFYTIGKNEYCYAGNCSKCSLNWHKCKEYCKKYRCSYLERFELNK